MANNPTLTIAYGQHGAKPGDRVKMIDAFQGYKVIYGTLHYGTQSKLSDWYVAWDDGEETIILYPPSLFPA